MNKPMIDLLYTLLESGKDDLQKSYSYRLTLNENHEVFKGHFPEQPVLPGVCQILIVTELLEKELDLKLLLNKANNIKFLKMIDPKISNELIVKTKIIEQNGSFVRVSSTIETGDSICLKFNGQYMKER